MTKKRRIIAVPTANIFNKSEDLNTTLTEILAFTAPHRAGINLAGSSTIGSTIMIHQNINTLVIPCTAGSTYTPKCYGTYDTSRSVFAEVDSSGIILRFGSWPNGTAITTTEANCAFLIIEDGGVSTVEKHKFCVVKGSTAPDEYIAWGTEQRILKENTTGFRLVQDYAECGSADLSTYSWQKRSDEGATPCYFTSYNLTNHYPAVNNIYLEGYYTNPTLGTYISLGDKECCAGNTEAIKNALHVRDDSFANKTAAEFAASLAGKIFKYQRTADPTWGVTHTEALTSINRILVSEEE